MENKYTLILSAHNRALTSDQLKRLVDAFVEATELFGEHIEVTTCVIDGDKLIEALNSFSETVKALSTDEEFVTTVRSLSDISASADYGRTGKGERKRNGREMRQGRSRNV